MKNRKKIVFKTILKSTFLALFFIACSNDDDSKNNEIIVENDIETAEIVCGEDMSNYSGTICCVTESSVVGEEKRSSYEYDSNKCNSVFTWEVYSGSISIVSGQGTSIVTVEFGDDFTTGGIIGLGTGDLDLSCSVLFPISKE